MTPVFGDALAAPSWRNGTHLKNFVASDDNNFCPCSTKRNAPAFDLVEEIGIYGEVFRIRSAKANECDFFGLSL